MSGIRGKKRREEKVVAREGSGEDGEEEWKKEGKQRDQQAEKEARDVMTNGEIHGDDEEESCGEKTVHRRGNDGDERGIYVVRRSLEETEGKEQGHRNDDKSSRHERTPGPPEEPRRKAQEVIRPSSSPTPQISSPSSSSSSSSPSSSSSSVGQPPAPSPFSILLDSRNIPHTIHRMSGLFPHRAHSLRLRDHLPLTHHDTTRKWEAPVSHQDIHIMELFEPAEERGPLSPSKERESPGRGERSSVSLDLLDGKVKRAEGEGEGRGQGESRRRRGRGGGGASGGGGGGSRGGGGGGDESAYSPSFIRKTDAEVFNEHREGPLSWSNLHYRMLQSVYDWMGSLWFLITTQLLSLPAIAYFIITVAATIGFLSMNWGISPEGGGGTGGGGSSSSPSHAGSEHGLFGSQLNTSTISLALIFPITMLTTSAFQRREHALHQLSLYKGHLFNILTGLTLWNWKERKGRDSLPPGFNRRALHNVLEINTLLCRILRLPQIGKASQVLNQGKERRALVSELDSLMLRIAVCLSHSHGMVEVLKGEGLPANEASRINQYHDKLMATIHHLVHIKKYRTPQGLRTALRFFLILFPIFFGPYYQWVAINETSATNSVYTVCYALYMAFIFISLVMVERQIEDPFLLSSFTNYTCIDVLHELGALELRCRVATDFAADARMGVPLNAANGFGEEVMGQEERICQKG